MHGRSKPSSSKGKIAFFKAKIANFPGCRQTEEDNEYYNIYQKVGPKKPCLAMNRPLVFIIAMGGRMALDETVQHKRTQRMQRTQWTDAVDAAGDQNPYFLLRDFGSACF